MQLATRDDLITDVYDSKARFETTRSRRCVNTTREQQLAIASEQAVSLVASVSASYGTSCALYNMRVIRGFAGVQ